jgi:ferredoxin
MPKNMRFNNNNNNIIIIINFIVILSNGNSSTDGGNISSSNIFWRVGKIAKSNCYLCHVCLSVCPSARLSVLMEQLGSHWTDFHKIWYTNIFKISVEKIEVALKWDQKNGYFTWRAMYIFDHISHSSLYNENWFTQTLVRRSKHISYVHFF